MADTQIAYIPPFNWCCSHMWEDPTAVQYPELVSASTRALTVIRRGGWVHVKASVFCNVSARSRHFVNVDVIFLPSVCDSFCVSTFSLGQGSRSFCHELYEQSTVMFCWSGRDACFTIVCILCADHVFWYPWFLCREFNSFVLSFLVCMQT